MKKYDVDGDNVISMQECTVSPLFHFCLPIRGMESPIGPGANSAMKSAMVNKVTIFVSFVRVY